VTKRRRSKWNGVLWRTAVSEAHKEQLHDSGALQKGRLRIRSWELDARQVNASSRGGETEGDGVVGVRTELVRGEFLFCGGGSGSGSQRMIFRNDYALQDHSTTMYPVQHQKIARFTKITLNEMISKLAMKTAVNRLDPAFCPIPINADSPGPNSALRSSSTRIPTVQRSQPGRPGRRIDHARVVGHAVDQARIVHRLRRIRTRRRRRRA
jgi:hypothetical protein